MTSTKAVSIVSGGMDSITLAYYVQRLGFNEQLLLSFNYGQRHKKELQFAKFHAEANGWEHEVIDLTGLTKLIGGSSLTQEDIEVPDGHYAEESMRITVVPNRNMIMLSIAAGVAVAQGASKVFTGVHAGDHFIYPDCREPFINAASDTVALATEGFADWSNSIPISAPFVRMGKHDIVTLGDQLHVRYDMTWSCYKGDYMHCGRCGTCVERKEAFRLARVGDPTDYKDDVFEVEAYRG